MARIDALLVVPVPVAVGGAGGKKRRNMKRRRSGVSGGYQKRERTRGKSARGGTATAAAAAVAVLGLAALSPRSTLLSKCGGSGTGTVFAAAAASTADRGMTMRRLPQRRVRTPRRAVPYPPAHPLTRHLETSVENGHYSSEDGGQEVADDENEATTTKDDKDQDDEEKDGDGDGDDRDRSSSSTSSPAPTPFRTAPPAPIPEPIRIVPILTAATKRHLTKYQQSYVLDTVLQPAIDAWSDIISLVRVQGNLTLDRTQLWDGVSCGPGLDGSGTPSAVVPEHHFHDYVHKDGNATATATATTTAPGVPNADLVVYIELGYRQMQQQDDNVEDQDDTPEESTYVDEESNHPGFVRGSDPRYKDAGFEALPTKELLPVQDAPHPSASSESSSAALSTASISLNISSTHPSLTGIIDPDVSASLASAATAAGGGGVSRPTRHVEHPKCSPAYLASATHCSTDQFDRPTHGMIHFCVDPKTFFSSETDDVRHLQLTRLTAMHELGHILGFNIQSLAHFREIDGTPRTPRIPAAGGTNITTSATEPWVVGDVADVKVECTGILPPGPGNGNNRKKRRRRAILPLPSRSTLRFRTIRGGLRVADVVLPTVRTVVRNHFSCDTLDGAELEGEPYSVERQQDPWLLTTASSSPESETDAADTISSAVTTDEGKRRRVEEVGDRKKNADGRDRRGDFDFLEHGVTVDQDGISDVDQKEYYNDDSDIGFCIGDHWVSSVTASLWPWILRLLSSSDLSLSLLATGAILVTEPTNIQDGSNESCNHRRHFASSRITPFV